MQQRLEMLTAVWRADVATATAAAMSRFACAAAAMVALAASPPLPLKWSTPNMVTAGPGPMTPFAEGAAVFDKDTWEWQQACEGATTRRFEFEQGGCP